MTAYRSRPLWGLTALAGLATLGFSAWMGAVPHQTACDGNHALGAMIRFELVGGPADVRQLFGNNPCRTLLADALDAMNRIDVRAFIPAFTFFQICGALAMRERGRVMASAVILAALVAGVCDVLEDGILFAIAGQVRAGEAHVTAPFAMLFLFVRAKFGLLAVAALLLGLLVRRADGWLPRFAGLAMIGGGLVSLIGQWLPSLLGSGLAVAWVALLIVAIGHSLHLKNGANLTGVPV